MVASPGARSTVVAEAHKFIKFFPQFLAACMDRNYTPKLIKVKVFSLFHRLGPTLSD